MTHSTFWKQTVNYGEMLFQTVIVDCTSSASDGLLVFLASQ